MARRSPGRRIARDLLRYAVESKKWWMIPVVLVSLLLILLVATGSTPLAPFVYTLF
jgi:hypothetical protein